MKGFFHQSDLLLKKPEENLLPKCGSCKLHLTCQSPKMPVTGKGRRKILVVGEAPGEQEDIQNRQFVGKTGAFLEECLHRAGIDLRQDCWITNALICRPPKNQIGDQRRIDWCRPNLIQTIKRLQPEVILLLGKTPVQSLIGWLWKDDVGVISRWVGWHIPCQRLNAWICPTWHPSYIIRSDYGESKKVNDVRVKLFQDSLNEASRVKGRPWKELPDYRKQVKRIYDHEEASRAIDELVKGGKPLAFDYETNMIKPDRKDAGDVLGCSISDGVVSLAYPWVGRAVEATRRFLEGPVGKIGWNAKYEDRWTMNKIKCSVNNWIWDGMIAAHVLDCREAITSLKFQAFVQLGMPSYDHTLKPFMKVKGGNVPNRMKEIPLDRMLLYCGLDSLLTHKIATIQMERMNYAP